LRVALAALSERDRKVLILTALRKSSKSDAGA
jgi:hypothetical protein